MMKLISVAELLIEKIKRDYHDDIAVVVVMGSYVFDEIHDLSDLDLYYVPKTERGSNLGFTFIIDEIGFDLWPISWERLENIADHKERITSIVTDGRLLYYSTEEDLNRFNNLKKTAENTEDRNEFTKKAEEVLNASYKHVYDIQEAESLSEVRRHGIQLLNNTAYALSLLNGKTIRRGRSRLKHEVMSFPLVPENYSALYDTIFISNQIDEIKRDLLELFRQTEKLICAEREKHLNKASIKDVFSGFYEELINFYNKIEHAHDISDPVTCLFAACEIHKEIDDALRYTDAVHPVLPDIVSCYDPKNLKKILTRSKENKAAFVDYLEKNHVEIRRFNNLEEYQGYLNTL